MKHARILLGPDIIIQRELAPFVIPNIAILFKWLDFFQVEKCLHPTSLLEIQSYSSEQANSSIITKLNCYTILKTLSPMAEEVKTLFTFDDTNKAKANTSLLNEVYCSRVDILITENRAVHQKAGKLGIDNKVYTISEFLERSTEANPPLVDYKVLAVKQELFGNINLHDSFFDSFRRDYHEFDKWFIRKSDETAYICKGSVGNVDAFLYIKVEDENELYPDIYPPFEPKRRLKVGTLKVTLTGYTLGERLLKIVFDNALSQNVEEIYLTIFNKDDGQERLITLLYEWGFSLFGEKRGKSGNELVLVRNFARIANTKKPSLSYPFVSNQRRKFIVSIYPEYHTELLPDSILKNERPADFIENKANRNSLKKVFISRSFRRDMTSGDILVFYRTKFNGPAHHTAVVTTLGVVESVITEIKSEEQFKRLCRKRSVFSDEELAQHWSYNSSNRPFIVNFLYVCSFPSPRPNLTVLKSMEIIHEAPRGFDILSNESFNKLIEKAHADQSLIVD